MFGCHTLNTPVGLVYQWCGLVDAWSDILYYAVLTVAAALAAILVYLAVRRLVLRVLAAFMDRRLVLLLELLFILLALSLFLAVISSIYGLSTIFIVTLAVFLAILVAVLVGTRHVIEEYLTGLVAVKAYDLKVGDYIEFNTIRGHIVALDDMAIVVRDSHRDLVYIPYTRLVHGVFKRFRVEEGHEVRVHILVPHGVGLKRVKEEIVRIAESLGLENVRVDIGSVRSDGVILVARGIIRDPRREEEVRYAILDQVYGVMK